MRWVCVLALAACRFSHGDAASADAALDDAGDAADDAAIDGRPFDPATDCPLSYLDTLGSSASRYRIDQAADLAWPRLASCDQDLAGRTHAMVPNSQQEVVDLDALLDSRNTIDRFYLGGVQSPTATLKDADWIGFDGKQLLASAWHTPEAEPDDGGNASEVHGQQLLIFDRTLQYLHDATGVSLYGVVCECDGVPVHPTATSYVDTDPNNPN